MIRYLRAIRATVVEEEATDILTEPIIKSSNGHKPHLSPKQLIILQLLANGLFDKQIAKVIGISEQTVKNHCGMIYKKLHAYCRPHAVALGLKYGIISYPEPAEDIVD